MSKLNRFASVSLLLVMISGAAELRAAEKATVVKGAVTVDGLVPAPREFKLEDEMRRITGEERYLEETWLVGEGKGLANCLVTLKSKDPGNRLVPKPLDPG